MAEVKRVEPEFEQGMELDLLPQEPELEGRFPARVLSIHDGLLEVPLPKHNDFFLPIDVDTELDIEYHFDEAKFAFEALIDRRSELVSSPRLMVRIPDTVKRIQHREHFRVSCDIDADIRIISGTAGTDIPREMDVVVRDLSAGGLEFTAEHPVPEGSRVQFILPLPLINEQLDDLFARVVRLQDDEDPPVHGVTFKGLTSNQEDLLVNYGFRRQAQIRRQEIDQS